MKEDMAALNEKVRRASGFIDDVLAEAGRVVVGQRYMMERLLMGFLADGHVLVEGVPGLAKTTAVKTLADCVSTGFKRIQFTPDLLPADIIGTMIYNHQKGVFETKKGPIFSNIILADEINRAPAKVQSALLEAMQERQVTIGDNTFPLDDPFLVMATQNPIEQEGTYPLPEAQVDRFMMKLKIGYPSKKEEALIVERNAGDEPPRARPVVTPDVIIEARKVCASIYVDEGVKEYILDVVFATREPGEYGLGELEDLIEYGASPRASIWLTRAAKAHAFLKHRGYVTPDDVKAVGADVLRHRIILSYEAEAEELTSDDIVRRIFDTIEVP